LLSSADKTSVIKELFARSGFDLFGEGKIMIRYVFGGEFLIIVILNQVTELISFIQLFVNFCFSCMQLKQRFPCIFAIHLLFFNLS
jgi:hypothetical protein